MLQDWLELSREEVTRLVSSDGVIAPESVCRIRAHSSEAARLSRANHDDDNSHPGDDLGDNSQDDSSSVRPESRNPNSDNDSSPEPRSCCCCLS